MTEKLMEIDHVSRTFPVGNQPVRAVNNVSLAIERGEILCLVGESGCGKTTTGRIVAGLLKPTAGRILFEGRDIWTMDDKGFRQYRKAVQIVHQDPYASLNPVHSIYKILSAPLFRHGLAATQQEALIKIRELLQIVDLTPPEEFLDKYPHQLSGGQRQRISVARALTVNPRFIVADEAVSMVDVSIRVSLLNMLSRLKDQLGVTFLFITHDLALAKYFAWEGRIAVMYLGCIVEVAATPRLINDPSHPYSRALLSALPEADPELTRTKKRVALRSLDVPSLLDLPSGCTFHPRCPQFREGLCERQAPELAQISDNRYVACHLVAPGTTPRWTSER
ncbi:MAG: ABC transporter ATP-binding protein [Chloroflexi bacterium]|nr:ABC transporter ATP-binding protein [Chloroflexota bacterium]